MKRLIIYTLLVFSFTFYVLRLQGMEIDFIPSANLSLLGGQYFFEKEAASFGGNAYLEFAPSLQFTDELSLIPTYSGAYRGTKNVTELVGGGTLYQQAQDHLLALRLTNQMTEDLKLKINTSYKLELLRETKDESWGDGLFDYYKIAGGVEGEKKFYPKTSGLESVTGGYTFYTVGFNNYSSLAEKTTSYGQELTGKVGKKVLDFSAHEIYFYSKFALRPDVQLKLNYGFTYKSFPDQNVIISLDTYGTKKRKDQIHLLNLLASHFHRPKGRLRFLGFLGANVTYYDSNQNHSDASKIRFIPDYYDYWELAIRPGVSVQFGKKGQDIDFSYEYAFRSYPERLAQDATGNYLEDEKIRTKISTISLGTGYPLSKKINLRFQINYLASNSNMKDETVYQYNYDTINYFLGISLEY